MLVMLLFIVEVNRTCYAQVSGMPAAEDSRLEDERRKIHEQYNYLLEEGRFTDHLDLGETIDFPIGIRKTIGTLEYIIAIDSIVITPEYAFLNASMSFAIPQSDDRIAFRGTNIKFSHDGGLAPGARLELVGNYRIGREGSKVFLLLEGDDTFVEWDCDGFKRFSLNAGLAFSTDLVEPINSERQVIKGEEVKALFKITADDWNDIIASASITPFQVKGLEGFSFFVKDVMVDFSDVRNPSGIYLSPAYATSFLPNGHFEIWRGVYFQGIEIYLPDQFNTAAGESPKIAGKDIWIDEFGLSGDFNAEHLVTLNSPESSSMQGWPFSITKFEVSILANRIKKASFSGEIRLPIANENTPLAYQAFIDQNNDYFFSISPAENLEFDIWKAGNVEIHKSSFIKVAVIDKKFYPIAKLNGKMAISVKETDSPQLVLPSISFEELAISSKAPYISGGNFYPEFNAKQQSGLAGFSLDIEKIGLKNIDKEQIALEIETGVILTDSDGGNFAAKGGIKIISKYNQGQQSANWQFEKIVLDKFKIDVSNSGCQFKGELVNFNNDPTYGNGFKGKVDATFKPGIRVKAHAIFGRKGQYNYWYADALATFPSAISISPGFGIYGFGGGASYHMKLESTESNAATSSGVRYIPDMNAGLRLKAAVNVGTIPSPKAFNGDASFEIAFYKGGGIKSINFKGEGRFMTSPVPEDVAALQQNLKKIVQYTSNASQPDRLMAKRSNDESAVSGNLNINYDFANRILHGNIEVFVNAQAQIIQGMGSGGKAGWAVMHFEPASWYIHIGSPDNRIGLKIGIGDVIAKTNAYFMVGDNIPGSPPPDKNVSAILGGIDLDYMRDENALAKGTGFAMGAALSFDTGDLTFWKFYARFMAGAGFDLMLKNYGSGTTCSNRPGVIGINGWYANGQAYAYFDGNIGIIVKVFGDERKIEIIKLAAATVLQAKLPNPVWMRGVVGGNFSALGGLISGNCKFEVTIGEECDLGDVSAVSGLEIIADITPSASEEDVNVFTNPQAVFNLPVNKAFELTNSENVIETYRIKLDLFRVRNGINQIDATIEWNETGDVAILKSHDILTPLSELKVDVQISYEKKIGGTWSPVTTNGNVIIEQKSVEFKTGTAPDFIPSSNIALAYPVLEMENYYPEESRKGYLQLIKGQDYLFEDNPEWQQVARIVNNGTPTEFEFNYNKVYDRIEYQLPELKNNEYYSFQIVNSPTTSGVAIDQNVATQSTAIDSNQDIKLAQKSAGGSIINLEETILFKNTFRTSRYNTFVKKMEASAILRTSRPMLAAWDLHRLESFLNADESFSKAEIKGKSSTGGNPLLVLEAKLERNQYFNNKIGPVVYANYPIDGEVTITDRDIGELGVVPIKAVTLTSTGLLQYDLPIYYKYDFSEIRNKVIPRYIHTPDPLPDQIRSLLFYAFPIVPRGKYEVAVSYYLPGEEEPNSTYLLNVNLDY